MGRFLINFVAVLLALATVTGLYLGAAAVNLHWLFWLIIGASILIALARSAWPPVQSAFRQWRAYPGISSRLGDLEARAVKLESDRDAAEKRARAAFEEGVLEGRAQAIGAVLAVQADPPTITGIADYDGAVSLVAVSDQAIPVSARFNVVVAATGALRGIVEVAGTDPDRKLYFLTCVVPTTAAFWMSLRDKVDIDSSPPHGVTLERFTLNSSPSTTASVEIETRRPEAKK